MHAFIALHTIYGALLTLLWHPNVFVINAVKEICIYIAALFILLKAILLIYYLFQRHFSAFIMLPLKNNVVGNSQTTFAREPQLGGRK